MWRFVQVAAGDVLCDIETDKATLDLECMEDGYALLKLFVIVLSFLSGALVKSFTLKVMLLLHRVDNTSHVFLQNSGENYLSSWN